MPSPPADPWVPGTKNLYKILLVSRKNVGRENLPKEGFCFPTQKLAGNAGFSWHTAECQVGFSWQKSG
jgi:hypothetical protein